MDCVFLALTESLGLPAHTEVVKIENLLFKRKEEERATSSAKEIAEILQTVTLGFGLQRQRDEVTNKEFTHTHNTSTWLLFLLIEMTFLE